MKTHTDDEALIEEFERKFGGYKLYFTRNGREYEASVTMIKNWLRTTLATKNQQIEEAITKGRVSVLEDFDNLMKADAFIGFTNEEWKAVQKFFRYNDEISGWKQPLH